MEIYPLHAKLCQSARPPFLLPRSVTRIASSICAGFLVTNQRTVGLNGAPHDLGRIGVETTH